MKLPTYLGTYLFWLIALKPRRQAAWLQWTDSGLAATGSAVLFYLTAGSCSAEWL